VLADDRTGGIHMTETRPFDPAMFRDAAIDPETARLNAQMIELLTGQPEWWIIGAEAMRAARRRGEGPFPAPVMSNRARTLTITGRDGNEIPLRVIASTQPVRGIYLHLHGGGWVLGGADMQDPMLERIADNTGQAVVAPEYRLAPEHPSRRP
jgi:acetyl esterase